MKDLNFEIGDVVAIFSDNLYELLFYGIIINNTFVNKYLYEIKIIKQMSNITPYKLPAFHDRKNIIYYRSNLMPVDEKTKNTLLKELVFSSSIS